MAQAIDPAALEDAIRDVGRGLARAMPARRRGPSWANVERRLTAALMADPSLRAALFRFVDVRPACTSSADLVRHLEELLDDAGDSRIAARSARVVRALPTTVPVAAIAGTAVDRIAERFIVGADAASAVPTIAALWREGVAVTVDLLGEATVTEQEADRYFQRCRDAIVTLSGAARSWPERPQLERDAAGAVARVNLSVKISALTPGIRPDAPSRGIAGARDRLRELLRTARDHAAHLHVDMESLDTRETITALTLQLLSERELADGPSCGVVLQAYTTDSGEQLDRLLAWNAEHPRAHPLTIRLVKGAYWDHEVVQAAQNGWRVPVHTDRAACDRNFEALTRRLVDRLPHVRVAIASHNLRSIAHAAAYAAQRGHAPTDIEFQVLRGLGDETQTAEASLGYRVRCYCPVGDLVAGMAYLVRRLLENTANDSFLAAASAGADLETLLEAP